MNVDPGKARFKTEYSGKVYYFCSETCKKAFDREPTKYVK
jgi:YHS domain-containing protein